jgi:hypothetical protein
MDADRPSETLDEHAERERIKKERNPNLGKLHKPPTLIAQNWVTPRSAMHKNSTGQVLNGDNLEEQVTLWPTPRTITGGGESGDRKRELGRKESGGGDLQAAASLWGTPTSHERTQTPRDVDHGVQLANQVDLWRTPTVGAPNADRANPLEYSARKAQKGQTITIADEARMWPTPNVPNGGRTMTPEDIANKGMTDKGKRQVGLENVAQIWPTPKSRDWKGGQGAKERQSPDLDKMAEVFPSFPRAPQTETPGSASSPNTQTSPQRWPTPRTCAGKGSSGAPRTEFYEKMEECGTREGPQWRTPAGSDGEGGTMEIRPETTGHYKLGDQVGSRARLNPRFVTWLMNLPIGWVDPAPLEWTNYVRWVTASSRLLRRLRS